MPPSPTASVSYKKKDGSLTISPDQKYVFWATTGSTSPTLTIPVADITNLQQTPASAPKVALKIFVKDDNYVFSFTSKENARKEQETVTDSLRNTIAGNKAATTASQLAPAKTGTPQQNGGDAGQSAAMAIAKAVSSKQADEAWYDDSKLKSDIHLQRSLLQANTPLQARFNEALKDKPESVSIAQFTTQFWSARLHLLRAHAIDKAQKQGEYNVLPEIKFTRRPGEKDGDPDIKQLHITKEQIKLIFRQYPVVKEAYDENVPPLDPGGFWQRFFSSRLLKKLKGEKITQQDPPDAIMDKYLERRELGPANISHIPHFIDLEGNEQNHSQRKGNRPDQDMRPSSYEKVPILRVLNNLSEKMLSRVAPEDGEAHAPVGVDEGTFEQLRLRDLAMVDDDNRVKLNIQEPGKLGGGEDDDDLSADARLYLQQDPADVMRNLLDDMQPERLGSDDRGTVHLDEALNYHSDPSSDSEDETHQANGHTKSSKRTPAINSHAALNTATTALLQSITTNRFATSTSPSSFRGLSQQSFDSLTITHNTTTEFLHYFWTLFLSGDPSNATELEQLVSTLNRSLDRIEAVKKVAEQEKQARLDDLERRAREAEKRTGKRRRVDRDVGGGAEVVAEMVAPTVRALGVAAERYRVEYERQTQEVKEAKDGGGAG